MIEECQCKGAGLCPVFNIRVSDAMVHACQTRQNFRDFLERIRDKKKGRVIEVNPTLPAVERPQKPKMSLQEIVQARKR